ncbi:ABC transporter permease [Paenibacillus sediminis]|uniref:Peptide/nickel transport system permease protein n=1 Tax=Paenibacillus sediminis TaxID=664909 RepID=A0ABS4H132_9BACL|nr:ABC transporter permease [Paenibacillus sediminis]MBP1936240.1 peptide/nickel transport system permease protein [Paenibacillus sediminis]
MRFILNRLGFFVLSLWAAITINFILPRLMPGNPADIIFAKFQGQLDPASIAAMKKAFGLTDKPMIIQYFEYLRGLLTGNWGLSFGYYPTPVIDIIKHSLPWTIGLVGLATVLAVFIGTSAGIYISWKRQGFLDNTLPLLTMGIQALPYFWVALLFLFVFGFKLNWFPMNHGYDNGLTPEFSWTFFSSVLYHGFLPGITILLGSLSGWLVGMRNNMINTLGEDYVVFAEAKGVSPSRLMFTYAARNAILPQLTSFAIAIGNVVSGSILTEQVFSYPGIGGQLTNAVLLEDFPLIQSSFLLIAVAVLVANLIVDLLYSRLDPRVRTGGITNGS